MKKQLLLLVLLMVVSLPFMLNAQNGYHLCKFNSGHWIPKSPMPESRGVMVSSVMNGKIYSTCGYYDNYVWDTVINEYVVDTSFLKKTLMVYDPLADTWDTTASPIPHTRAMHNPGQSVVEGLWYVVGGLEWDWTEAGYLITPLPRVDIYDPQTDSWEMRANLPEPLGGNAICTLDGKLYVTGGGSGLLSEAQLYKSVYMYDPEKDTWTAKADMNYARVFHLSFVVDGKIYVIGGVPEDKTTNLVPIEVYDPDLDQWSVLSSTCPVQVDAGGCVVADAIYLFGGMGSRGGDYSADIIKYEPETDRWAKIGEMPERYMQHSVCEVEGQMYIFGGIRDSSYATLDEYKLGDLVLDKDIPDKLLNIGDTINLDLTEHFRHLKGDSISYTICTQTHNTVKESIEGHMLMLTGIGASSTSVRIRADSENDVFGTRFNVEVTPVSVHEEASEIFQMFPNPAGDILNVEMQKEGPYEYRVLSPSGQKVLEGKLSGKSKAIDISRLDKGMFFIQVYSTELAVTRKFLKIR